MGIGHRVLGTGALVAAVLAVSPTLLVAQQQQQQPLHPLFQQDQPQMLAQAQDAPPHRTSPPPGGAKPQANTPRQSVAVGNPVAPSPAAPDPVDGIKHPVEWLNWGADLRLRHEYMENPYLRTSDPPGDLVNYHRYRARLWSSVAPFGPNFDINTRLAWEGRYWFEPASKGDWDPSSVFVDNANVRFRLGTNGNVPSTLSVGRQDIMLGDGWLVFDGTPLDGSRTIYFDAARLTMDFKQVKTTADVIVIQQYADVDTWLPPIDISANEALAHTEQDETAVILYGSNKSLKGHTIEPYVIYKHADPYLANGDDADVVTLGTRVVRDLTQHWQVKVEGAYQFGERDNPVLFPTSDGDLSAFGATARLTHMIRDAWNTQVYVGYEFLSGDDPDTSGNEQFDPLWGRWPQWSDLYVYTVAGENRIGEISNLHRLNVGAQTSPVRQLALIANYDALFADEDARPGRAGYGSGNFRGHLVTGAARFKWNRFAATNLVAEYFVPGDFYSDDAGGSYESRDQAAAFFRAELVLTF